MEVTSTNKHAKVQKNLARKIRKKQKTTNFPSTTETRKTDLLTSFLDSSLNKNQTKNSKKSLKEKTRNTSLLSFFTIINFEYRIRKKIVTKIFCKNHKNCRIVTYIFCKVFDLKWLQKNAYHKNNGNKTLPFYCLCH